MLSEMQIFWINLSGSGAHLQSSCIELLYYLFVRFAIPAEDSCNRKRFIHRH